MRDRVHDTTMVETRLALAIAAGARFATLCNSVTSLHDLSMHFSENPSGMVIRQPLAETFALTRRKPGRDA